MPQYFINEQGQQVGLCTMCNRIKPKSHLLARSHDTFHYCHECNRKKTRRHSERGHMIREILLVRAGGCVWPGCHMQYPRDFRGNFALDHINPRLKLHIRETQPMWISCNQEEFWSRVAPNLQVLCQHHNNAKSTEEYGVGGDMHVEPWDYDDQEIPHIDFNEVKLVLPGFEEFANPLT